MTLTINQPLGMLLPVIAAHRDEAEARRQLSDEVCRALRESGLLQMPIAAAHGGLETPLPDMLRVFEAMASKDAAVSWVVWNAGLIGFYSRFMPDQLRDELFAGGTSLITQSTIPAGEVSVEDDGSVRIQGRWPLMSGCPGADWAVLTCRLIRNGAPCLNPDGSPQTRLAVVPRDAFQIIDTWDTSGLRGTGSHDISIEGALVPDHRLFDLGGEITPAGVVERLPVFASATAIFAAQTLGVGQSIFDTALDRGRTLKATGPAPALKDRPDYQIAIARHGACLDAARTALLRVAQDVWDRARGGHEPDLSQIADLYGASFVAMDAAKAAATELRDLSGTSALHKTSPIEKPARDLQAMLRHVVAQPAMRADIGRAKLGLEPTWPPFFM
nr:acyl-CoA dehydrogenase family protein [Hyphomonas sp. Mor2]